MKKALIVLLAATMLFTLCSCTVSLSDSSNAPSASTESKTPSARDALTNEESVLVDYIIKFTSRDFFNPSAIRILEIGDEVNTEKSHTILVRLQGENKSGGTLNQCYRVYLKEEFEEEETWEVTSCEAASCAAPSSALPLAPVAKGITHPAGDYTDMGSRTIKTPSNSYNIKNMNLAIAEYWKEEMGIG